MIPKKIHFIWVQGYDAMPDDYKRCVDSWAPKNPGWEVKVWSAADMTGLGCAWALNLPTTTFVCDVMRFAVVYEHGGIYFDADHECMKPIGELLGTKNAFVSQRNRRVIENSGFGAEPGAAWLGEILSSLSDNRAELKHSVDTDIYYHAVLKKYPKIDVIPYWLLQSMNGPQDIWKHGKDHAYAVHHRYALWTKEKPEYADAYGKVSE